MKRRVVITGGAGFIGTHLAERLLSTSHVVLFDNLKRDALQAAPALQRSADVELVQGDVMDTLALSRVMAGAKVVFHLAAIAGVSSYYDEPLETLTVNIFGTVNTLEAALQANVDRFVAFSTSEVFGPEALWVDETAPCRLGHTADRRWVYATSKITAEQFVRRYGEVYGMPYTIVRPFNVYGPRQTGEGAISNFCRAAVAKQPLVVHGDGSAMRAWCYVDEFADVVASLPDREQAVDQDFNIGNPAEVTTTLGLARAVKALMPDARIELRPSDRAEVKVRVPCIDKARALLGFEPATTLETGLTRTLAAFAREARS